MEVLSLWQERECRMKTCRRIYPVVYLELFIYTMWQNITAYPSSYIQIMQQKNGCRGLAACSTQVNNISKRKNNLCSALTCSIFRKSRSKKTSRPVSNFSSVCGHWIWLLKLSLV